jgi:hypothetical protein
MHSSQTAPFIRNVQAVHIIIIITIIIQMNVKITAQRQAVFYLKSNSNYYDAIKCVKVAKCGTESKQVDAG